MEKHQLVLVVLVVKDQQVLVVHMVLVVQVEVELVVEAEAVVHEAEEYLQVVGVQVDVEVGHGLVAEDVQVEVILGVVEDPVVVDGVLVEVAGFILDADIVVVRVEDGLIQNQEEDGDIVEHNLLC